MSSLLSFPRDRIRLVLFEGIHAGAAATLQKNGYTGVQTFDTALEGDALRAVLADAHVVGIRSRTRLDRDALAAAPKLVAVGCFCIGTNQVDLDFAAERGVPVFNAPHSNTRSVAELVIGLTIMLERDAFRKSGQVHAGGWPKTAVGSREVRGKTIGIVGYGHIGSQVSVLAEAMGMKVVFHDIVPKLPLGNAEPMGSLDELLDQADIVTFHVPQTKDTVNLMSRDKIRALRKGAHVINTSRGVVVDLEALREAIEEGHVAGAAVDVFPEEPQSRQTPFKSPLQGLPNVILTPHVAGSTVEAQAKIGLEVVGKLMEYSDRGTTMGAVNFPQLTLPMHEDAHRILHIHRNVPGMLQQINTVLAEEKINVQAQHLETKGSIGYVVLDIEKLASSRIYRLLKRIDGTIRTRILY